MEWDRETRTKLAREIRRLSLEIQYQEFEEARQNKSAFSRAVENTHKRIMSRLSPLGFEPANKDWRHDGDADLGVNLYGDSPTHLWFETVQSKIVKIHKDKAEKLLVLGLP